MNVMLLMEYVNKFALILLEVSTVIVQKDII